MKETNTGAVYEPSLEQQFYESNETMCLYSVKI